MHPTGRGQSGLLRGRADGPCERVRADRELTAEIVAIHAELAGKPGVRRVRAEPAAMRSDDGWAYSRRVIGYAAVDHMRTDLIIEALAATLVTRLSPAGVIFHSDCACQYTANTPRTTSRNPAARTASSVP